jgi:acetyl-CoA carboxylase biotin carboxyl carrier protein
MNLKEIKKIIKVFESSKISEFELERGGIKLKLKKGGPPQISAPIHTPYIPAPPQEIQQSSTPASSPETFEQKDQIGEEKIEEITSPIVGTFYQSSSPDTEPFVKEGDVVEPDTIICIIEAMKLMNEIKAEKKGKITKILVKNGQAVEFGQPIFSIEPI